MELDEKLLDELFPTTGGGLLLDGTGKVTLGRVGG